MNIYIYGNTGFVNSVNKTLDHGNIRFKIEDGIIEEIDNLEKLQELIKDDPSQIFIIDQNLVIENDFISNNLKFLLPKNGIRKSFLDEFGVGDVSLREFDDLAVYVSKRLEAIKTMKPKLKADEITTIDQMFENYE